MGFFSPTQATFQKGCDALSFQYQLYSLGLFAILSELSLLILKRLLA